MKRNLLLLAVMIWVAFGFTVAQAQCPSPNDNGICDTLYLEVYPGQDGLFGYPADVQFPMFITNDIPVDSIDSIAGIVIPLCFTSTNAGANATIDIAKNNNNVYPFPDLENSIFQHVPTMDTLTATDRNFLMDIGYGFKTWDTRELVLSGGTTFWLSMIPSGSQNPRFPGGSRVLTATVTFTIDDSTNICIDTCFWPPTGRLAFARSDAVTYVPQIWDDYYGQEEVCVELFTIPNIPPYFTDTVQDQSHSQNEPGSTDNFTVVDDDGTISSVVASPASLPGVANILAVLPKADSKTGNVTYDVTDHCAAGGTVTITATDNQGGTGTDDFLITLTNDPPYFTSCPGNFTQYVNKPWSGGDPAAADDNGDGFAFSLGIVPAPGTSPAIDAGSGVITWVPVAGDVGTYTVTITVTENTGTCGLSSSNCSFEVTVEELANPVVTIGQPPCVNPGELVYVPISIDQPFATEEGNVEVGGFELHVDFDYTSMTFVGVERGELINGTQFGDFEKFTYRLLPCPSCGCCKYKILLFGIYDLPNGAENVGTAIPVGATGDLAFLMFVVNNNENLRGLKIPVCWQWTDCVREEGHDPFDPDCGENTFSDVTGNVLFTSFYTCQFDPSCCDDPGVPIERSILFQHEFPGDPEFADCDALVNCGGVEVCTGGEFECKRGDINLNEVPYEVADAVLFASYFVNGTSVFITEEATQICATDVNADGRPLTLSDLVYLIRVLLHDAVAIPDGKLTPSSEVANVIVFNGTITTECAAQIGAILFEFDSAVNPTLLADMEMVHNGNKVLVWSTTGMSFSTAQVLSYTGDAELVSVSAVDRDSRELETTITAKVAPTAFALHAAYPNPFNPFTNLSFNLPEAMNYSLNIYNVAGQLVRSYSGVGSQNLNVVTWDGRDYAGSEVSSGVYFYKLTAGAFSATEKMVMMK